MERMRLPNGREIMQLHPAETSLMYRNIVTNRSYLRHGVALRGEGTVFDVGANIGVASLAFHWEHPGIHLVACEPAPVPYRALAANFAAHQVNGVALSCALADRPGRARLTSYPEITAMTSRYADPDYDRQLTRTFLANSGFAPADIDEMVAGRHATETIGCELRTVSQIVADLGVTVIELLKVNVEKAECDVLAGIAETDWPRIRQIVVQLHDFAGRLEAMTTDLTRRGFRVAVDQDPLLDGTDIVELFAVRGGADRAGP